MSQIASTSSRLPLYRFLMRVRPAPVASLFKKFLGIKREVLNTHRGAFYLDPVSNLGFTLLQHGQYEPEMISTMERVLKPGSVFVDIGANEGYFSVLGSKLVGPSGKVIAVEPQRRLKAVLEKNLELNTVQNAVTVYKAISSESGKASLHISPDTNTGSTSLVQSTKYALPTEEVETTTLQALFDAQGIQQADLLKMDIEGFEYDAILGSASLFREHRVKAFALELHPWILTRRGLDVGDLTAFLTECGYREDKSFSTLVYTAN